MSTTPETPTVASTIASTVLEPAEPISSPHSLHQAVAARRSEYVRPHQIRVKIGTWNVAANPGTDKDLAGWFIEGKGVDPELSTISPSAYNSFVADGQDTASYPDVEGGSSSIRLVGGDRIGLYVLGLQEAADLYGPSLYIRPMYAGVGEAKEKWKRALEDAMPEGYQFVSSSQLAGLLLLVYASPEVAPTISNVSSTTVGTGLMGLLGNKGGVATRIVLGETTRVVFVNCHLASGHDQTAADRRVWDVQAIQNRARFDPVSYAGVSEDEGDSIGEEDFAFWLGDLNFRLEGLPGDDIRRLLTLHTRGEYASDGQDKGRPLEGEGVVVPRSSESSEEGSGGDSNTHKTKTPEDSSTALPDPDDFDPAADPHNDPASLQATLDSLLPHDQLARMMKERKVFHDGWREGPITFPPSYKYDVGTVSLFDSSEKRRAPSWCDRILYRTRTDRELHQQRVKEEEEARIKDEEMKARGMEDAAEDDAVLFDYDPDNDGDAQPRGQPLYDYDEYDDDGTDPGDQVMTKDGAIDRIHLDVYTSHQGVTSSDHKPVISVFTLDYDAVVPELKAKVHAEVARELDRAENEGRPGVTIVLDGHEAHGSTQAAHLEPSEATGAVNFGEIRFGVKQVASLTLANTGRVPATFSFVDKPTTDEHGETSMAPWLTTSFIHLEHGSDAKDETAREVTLEPGETVNAMLKAYVGEIPQVRMLNDGKISLEEVLVLRVTDGRDHFIPVRATWSPTCIGRSVEELIRVPDGGLRQFAKSQAEAAKGRLGSISSHLPVHFAAPKELFKLTEAVETLVERALADEQMLEECQIPTDAGWPFDSTTWKSADEETRRSHMTRLIDVLDNDEPLLAAFAPEVSSLERLESVSEVMLLFLNSLTDGIIPWSLWARVEKAPLTVLGQAASSTRQSEDQAAEDDKAAVLDILSSVPNHNISFVFLTTTLAKIISELSPLSKAALEALRTPGTTPNLGRRSLSFRRAALTPPAEAVAAMQRREARIRCLAHIFGPVICRSNPPNKEKEKKTLEDRQRAVLELFLKPREDV
jgi:phosphatidylinositol-bisphosphatase